MVVIDVVCCVSMRTSLYLSFAKLVLCLVRVLYVEEEALSLM